MNINTQENFHAPIDYTMGPYSNINVDNDINIGQNLNVKRNINIDK